MKTMSMNVVGELPQMENTDLPDDITEVCASVLNQYIAEDGYIKNDKEDHRLEKLMRFSEIFFRQFLNVTELHQQRGPDGVRQWQSQQNAVFTEHAIAYAPLYAQVQHMASAPHFMTNWAICFMVDITLEVSEVYSPEEYASLSKDKKEQVDYLLRYAENLLQSFYSKAVMK